MRVSLAVPSFALFSAALRRLIASSTFTPLLPVRGLGMTSSESCTLLVLRSTWPRPATLFGTPKTPLLNCQMSHCRTGGVFELLYLGTQKRAFFSKAEDKT